MVVVNEECYRENKPLLRDAMSTTAMRELYWSLQWSEHDEGSSDDEDVSEPRPMRVETASVLLTIRDFPPLGSGWFPLSSPAHTASYCMLRLSLSFEFPSGQLTLSGEGRRSVNTIRCPGEGSS